MTDIHKPKYPMQAVNTQVIMVPLEQHKSAGGVVLSKGMVYDGPKFQVIAVGPGRVAMDGSRIPICCKVGDWVMSAKGGIGFTVDRQKYIIVDEMALEVIIAHKDFDPSQLSRVELNG